MIKDALYAVTHGQDLSYDLAKDTMNKIMSGDVAEVPSARFFVRFGCKKALLSMRLRLLLRLCARKQVLCLMKVLLWKS